MPLFDVKSADSAQEKLPIKDIREGVVLLEDGSMKSVILVSSINLALKSEDEKNAIFYTYQEFLNSLNFPIQLSIISRRLDLTKYLTKLEDAASKEKDLMIKMQIQEYAAFIDALLDSANIMEKSFYATVPYYAEPSAKNKKIETTITDANFDDLRRKLLQRVDYIVNGLTSIGLRCVTLDTRGLLELYYSLYNPESAKTQKLTDQSDLGAPYISGGPTK